MKRLLLILATMLIAAPLVAADALPPFGPAPVSTNASSGSAVTSTVPVSGCIEAILLDVGGASTYWLTNGSTASDPDITGAYTLSGTYASSNVYTRDSGRYVIFYTNGVWNISTNAGYLAGLLWTNLSGAANGEYATAVSTATGVVQVVTGVVRMNVRVETVDAVSPRTLISVDDIAADAWYYPYTPVHSNANGGVIALEYDDIPLASEKIRVHAFNALGTNSTVKARVLFEK